MAWADSSRSPMGAWPVWTARLMSPPEKSEPLGWVWMSTSPPVASRTQSAKPCAVSVWKLVAG